MADFDLAIIGTGSGNSVLTPDFDGKRVVIIEEGTFGGTCLNVGCIPTKMFVYAAEVATTITESARYGIDSQLTGVRWPDIRDRIFDRIDPISAGGKTYRERSDNVTLLTGHARFIGPKRLQVSTGEGDVIVTAEQIVIATGAHPMIPDVIAESGVPFHTSDTIMRLPDLPRRLVIVGGGYIGAEFAHVFSALGSEITLISRSSALLRHLDTEISEAFTKIAGQQWDVRLSVQIEDVTATGGQISLRLSDGGVVDGDVLLVATGRVPNTSGLDLAAAGIDVLDDARLRVDDYGRTSVPGVYGLGDVSSEHQLKHVANHESRIVAHNLAHPQDLRPFDHRFVPAAVFTHPQLATVGLTEEEVVELGLDYVSATQHYSGTAYGWAMEDTLGLCKLIADPNTGLLLGAHLMGYQASNLIQPLIQAMSFGQRVTDVARGQYWIHPALMEVVENALLKLGLS
ncbi:mycothione reductase [Jatrophihabitans telluris]|uniref:Mycothione reductase n=1 Tax=Jatrophihabitans telluris TaxID=2038343 RepID=A0ABY4QYK8_9ACTN|nr:mycothione reductase [Jatrophihabitans telluris]UQX88086.1 mycothione reductase [Jatrophihabitans telluris]